MKQIKILLCLLVMILSTFTISITASAKLTGNESASSADNFDSYKEYNEFRIWSILKSLGMNDVQACAIMGCCQAEVSENLAPECVEGHYFGTYDEESSTQYKKDYSSKFATNHTEETDTLLTEHYGISSNDIAGAKKGTVSSAYSPSIGKNLSLSTYYIEGEGWIGIGLHQYTGTRSRSLVEFGKEHNVDWYEMENQWTWMLTPEDKGGDSRSPAFEEFKKKSKFLSLDNATYKWITMYINSQMSSDWVSMRQNNAKGYYSRFKGLGYDKEYGDKVISGAGLVPSSGGSSINNEIQDRGIIQSYSETVLHYPISKGFTMNINFNSKGKSQLDKNKDVLIGLTNTFNGKKDTSKKYSLYELFGDDLHWYRYFGESTYSPELGDHIWSAYDQNKLDKLGILETILYDNYNYLSCRVYKTRCTVLGTGDVKNGYVDPRVTTLKSSRFTGLSYVLGSNCLTIAKFFTKLMSILVSNAIIVKFTDILTDFEQGKGWELIKSIAMVLLGFAMFFFILSIASKVMKYARGKGSIREILNRLIIGFLAFSLLMGGLVNPTVFNHATVSFATAIDEIFNATLTKTLEKDEVIGTTDKNMIVSAVLWKTCIFNAWCRGQFEGKEYNELYTQKAKIGKNTNKSKMPQDNQKEPSKEDLENSIDSNDVEYYNSVQYTGDVYVPVGGNTKIRNWAAYLYSCGSTYHIEYTYDPSAANEGITAAGNGEISAVRQQIVELAIECCEKNDRKYVWGGGHGEKLDKIDNVDCSGFIRQLCMHIGLTKNSAETNEKVGNITDNQLQNCKQIKESELQPGDLVFFSGTKYNPSTPSIDHVTMYIGDGKIAHAKGAAYGLVIDDLHYSSRPYIYYGRPNIYEEGVNSSKMTTESKKNRLKRKDIIYPLANTTAYDSNIYADTFRVIDAQMNISPKIYKDGSIINNYSNSKTLNPQFSKEGAIMLINTLLLFLMIPVAFSKIKWFIIMIIKGFQIIFYTIIELFKEQQGLSKFWELFKKSIANYIVSCLKLNIMITLYMLLVDKGFVKAIIFILMCLVIHSYTLKDLKRQIKDVQYNITRIKSKI